ncbi:TPA: hypothetical protein ACIKG2_000861 [Streptococcus pyogenes]|uniref:Uncharacterized protein n=2 Tax=Streptococcus TaxID=1301 RepID=A0A4V0AA37_STRAP|nr:MULTISPECIES: hypothetical protein [Streptococcus]HER8963775.1 hypothetical protein [Streptococcus pyogenes]WOT14437.1 hypothetical protein F6I35_0001375 [Streptococcus anginosus]SUN62145.1 Uncharacterised protein [Streptococcus dysgalactiae subsp. equisimilis]VTS20236.1 Uncharacterised protein [Streptococcus anginosus]VTS50725.1 Uncharacterised protein [Streptococcus anginosus]
MLEKLKRYFGLDGFGGDGQSTSSSNLIELRALQVENRELKEVIRQKNALLRELSEENMELGRDRRRYADTVATQQRLIDVYESQVG